MRTIVELPEQQIKALKALSEQEGLSRAELVRRAVAEYLAHNQYQAGDTAFGLWRKRGQDSLTYQDQLRGEWEE